MNDLGECEVCSKAPAVSVASSTMGACSFAYCGPCLVSGAEPWGALVGGLYGCTRETVAEWARPTIEASLKVHDKTEDEVWTEVARATAEYDAEMQTRAAAEGDV